MTAQEIADKALTHDRARRAAERRSDTATAAAHDRAAAELCARIK